MQWALGRVLSSHDRRALHWGCASFVHRWKADQVAAVTPEEMRLLLAEHENHVEDRVARLVNSAVQPLKEQAQRIEIQTVKTNGRVTSLEGWRIESEARAGERAIAAKEAAALVAAEASARLQANERSRKWKITVITLGFTALSVGTPVVSSCLHHFGVL